MVLRTRSRDLRITECGSYKNYAIPPGTSVLRCKTHGVTEENADTVGDRLLANRLQISKVDTHFPSLNGQQFNIPGNGALLREFISFPVGFKPGPPDPRTKFPLYSIPELSNLAWEILAQTNPSSPHVNIPQFIGEMKDLPSLVKGWGQNLLKKAAKGYISWRWAVRPMVKDLANLSKFALATNRRLEELKRLRDGKTLRRRCGLGKFVIETAPVNVILHSEGALINGQRTISYTAKVWGSAEWKLLPDTEIPSMSNDQLYELANNNAAGLNSHGALAALWELAPWSWFVDWFSQVGTMLNATNNSVPLTWNRICVMRTCETHVKYDRIPAGSATWPTFDGWYREHWTRKERYPTFPIIPVPLPYLPILDDGKLSILLALAALRS